MTTQVWSILLFSFTEIFHFSCGGENRRRPPLSDRETNMNCWSRTRARAVVDARSSNALVDCDNLSKTANFREFYFVISVRILLTSTSTGVHQILHSACEALRKNDYHIIIVIIKIAIHRWSASKQTDKWAILRACNMQGELIQECWTEWGFRSHAGLIDETSVEKELYYTPNACWRYSNFHEPSENHPISKTPLRMYKLRSYLSSKHYMDFNKRFRTNSILIEHNPSWEKINRRTYLSMVGFDGLTGLDWPWIGRSALLKIELNWRRMGPLKTRTQTFLNQPPRTTTACRQSCRIIVGWEDKIQR